MAKTRGPLYSASASGAIGKTALFQTVRGVPAVRSMARFPRAGSTTTPKPPTPAQALQRARYADAVAVWNTLTPEEKALFAAWGAQYNLPAYPAAIKYIIANPLTTWDDTATTWDAGATIWDKPLPP